MASPVVAGNKCKCQWGTMSVGILSLIPHKVVIGGKPACVLSDRPPSFGMCSCKTNPAVISATAAASGVPTPAPCVPMFLTPWAPGAKTVLAGSMPLVNNRSKLVCFYGGVVTVVRPTVLKVKTP